MNKVTDERLDSPSAQGGVRALEWAKAVWSSSDTDYEHIVEIWKAFGAGHIQGWVEEQKDGKFYSDGEQFDTLAEAKSYVQVKYAQTILSSLEASPTAQGGVRVKLLEWSRDHVNKEWHGNVVVGTGYHYLVKDDGRWCSGPERRWVVDQIGDVDAAKAAAQADYERRILSSLEASPAPVSEEMVRENLPSRLTRAIVGIENRTAQEVFDIMCDRIRAALAAKGGQ